VRHEGTLHPSTQSRRAPHARTNAPLPRLLRPVVSHTVTLSADTTKTQPRAKRPSPDPSGEGRGWGLRASKLAASTRASGEQDGSSVVSIVTNGRALQRQRAPACRKEVGSKSNRGSSSRNLLPSSWRVVTKRLPAAPESAFCVSSRPPGGPGVDEAWQLQSSG
jgi:hypothetical protein